MPQISSSQNVPPPIIGVSPTRPKIPKHYLFEILAQLIFYYTLPSIFPVIPPVEVAAAISPLEFIATAPTVPNPTPPLKYKSKIRLLRTLKNYLA